MAKTVANPVDFTRKTMVVVGRTSGIGNGVAQGLVPTKLTAMITGEPARAERAVRTFPVGRMGTPSDMTGAVLFPASPLASYVPGQTLRVDGGPTPT